MFLELVILPLPPQASSKKSSFLTLHVLRGTPATGDGERDAVVTRAAWVSDPTPHQSKRGGIPALARPEPGRTTRSLLPTRRGRGTRGRSARRRWRSAPSAPRPFLGQGEVGGDPPHHREANGGVDLVRIIDRQLISQRLRELVVGLDPQGFVVPTFAVFRARDDDVPGVLIALEGEGTLRLLRPFLQQLDEQLLQLLVAEVEGALLVVEKLAIDPLRLVLLCHRRGRADRAGQQPQTEPGHAECSDDPLPIVQLNHCRPPDPVGQSRSHPWPPAIYLGRRGVVSTYGVFNMPTICAGS